MASRKKTKKSSKKAPITPKTFYWSYVWSIFLIILALFVFIGIFNIGGSLPDFLYKLSLRLFGYTAYGGFSLFLIYIAVYKFLTKNHKIPYPKLINIFLGFLFLITWFQVTFVSKDLLGQYIGGHGGDIGKFFGQIILTFLNVIASSILLLLAFILSMLFAFSVSPTMVWNFVQKFKFNQDDLEGEIGQLKSREMSNENFHLNEGVPVVHHNNELSLKPTKITNLKNSAQPINTKEMHEALTTVRDSDWKYPSISLLNQKQDKADAGDVNGNATLIRDTFANFKINVEMEGANIGPRVTQYTLKPPADVKLTKITALENNLALNLAAHSIRMEAPIPGKRAVGIEVPNVKPATVRISSLLASKEWSELDGKLGFVIGKDIAGNPVVDDLAKMPHLLVAGQTGSGKSVLINTLLTSLLYKNSPSDLKLILVDPKQVEMAPYNGLPHLLTPVINDPEKCISALKWSVAEMDRRLKTMAAEGKRNIQEYNLAMVDNPMPYIVIVIDELADLMMLAARDVESLIVRLAQKARAAGIHLVLATQRPSVDVITGLIKANVPARIAFTVASQVDSRTIIDQIGAEKLLGRGDMLLLTSDMSKPKRIQAALIQDEETAKITDFIRLQQPPNYDDEVVAQQVQIGKNGRANYIANDGMDGMSDNDDNLWHDAVKIVIENRKASTSLLQRKLRIGYGRAARIIENMEEKGIVGPADGSRPREVLVFDVNDLINQNASDIDDDQESTDEDSLN
jgi:S-DNA-T family DNA segregation ATPase FtsK/SpoIIIE